ncbi:tRNA-queuosine alpha-mannosyltransferase isoform X2 [Rhodnius prolixus]|uniref:tRNA-queuosine alpha-mannosyltransferase isoform X2 n=1 Tax=Rhodnius prolixus TaxID=13249 RepID=UPI003D187F1E
MLGLHFIQKTMTLEWGMGVLFTSSVLNLAELVALRRDLDACKKVVYFHENQLVYPVRQKKDRDFQYGYNETLTCLVADLIIFNSRYNCNSFLNNLKTHFRLQPDYRPRELKEKIAVKAEVLYFPVTIENLSPRKNYNSPVHIVWPHRWEHDKGVDEMVAVLFRLKKEKVNFRISMLGEQPSDLDNKYEDARVALGDHVLHWGFLQNESDYRAVLATAHLAISTAVHEFFGVAMMECVMSGCYPLCPDRLVYPELYPTQCLYGSQDELFAVIAKFASNMHQLQQQTLNLNINWSQYTVRNLLPKYVKCIMEI